MRSCYNLKLPMNNPPLIIPEKRGQVVLRTIKPCVNRYIYIWLKNGVSFWAWLTCIDCKHAIGYKWDGSVWINFLVSLDQIDSFACY